jgi:hypothetical protein
MALVVIACGATDSREAAVTEAVLAGAVPACASLDWIGQRKVDAHTEKVLVTARFRATTDDCSVQWEQSLLANGFEPQTPHGEMVKSSAPLIMVASASNGVRGVVFERDSAMAGVDIWQSGESDD